MTQQPNLYAWLNLALTPKIGPATIKKLLYHFGSIENIFSQDIKSLSHFINPTVAKLIVGRAAATHAEAALIWEREATNHHIITLDDKNYPKELKQINDPPPILFAKGRIELLNNTKFAIVGTRHPTEQGIANAHNFAGNLANSNLTIVSGLAYGVDRHAHLGAINTEASTIGVIGTGIDIIYPKSNKDVFLEMAEKGLILSEFPLQTQPLASNFPRRNRIVAGLSTGCLVIESTLDGGSLITANLALDMGREVMAIPGSIHNPVAKGCHKLIKSGAKLVENINDILEELTIAYNPQEQIKSISHPILDIMGYEAIEIDKICTKLNSDFSEVCSQLLELELAGHIVNSGNGKYQRIFK